jgi:hypothetical protein
METARVTGVVTLDGQPVDGATVSFSPKSEGAVAAAGITDASGRFSLSTTSGEGAAPGSYAVVITKAGSGTGKAWEDPRSRGGNLSPEDEKAVIAGATGQPGQPEDGGRIPKKYTSADTSGFTAEVKAGEKNEFTFDMRSE